MDVLSVDNEFLVIFDSRVEKVVTRIRAQHPDWRCKMGCDQCCRRLSEMPRVTQVEWERIRDGIATLPAPIRSAVLAQIEAGSAKEVLTVCPLLDQGQGACRIYAHRPLACRTYGYYDQRGIGLYCKMIEEDVNAGRLDDVVWGSQDSLEHDLKPFGILQSLTEWLEFLPVVDPA
jgi:uncharacterized protein